MKKVVAGATLLTVVVTVVLVIPVNGADSSWVLWAHQWTMTSNGQTTRDDWQRAEVFSGQWDCIAAKGPFIDRARQQLEVWGAKKERGNRSITSTVTPHVDGFDHLIQVAASDGSGYFTVSFRAYCFVNGYTPSK